MLDCHFQMDDIPHERPFSDLAYADENKVEQGRKSDASIASSLSINRLKQGTQSLVDADLESLRRSFVGLL